MASIADRVLDLGLNVLDTEATHVYICAAEPASYAAAIGANNETTQFGLGNKNFGAGAVFGAPAARGGGGRKVTSAAVTDGSVTTTGTATHYAIVDAANSRLLATGSLASSQVVTSGNTFTLAAFDVGIPGAV